MTILLPLKKYIVVGRKFRKIKKNYADGLAVGIAPSGRRHSPALGQTLTPSMPGVTASPVHRRLADAEGSRRHTV